MTEESLAVKVKWTSRVEFVVSLLGYSIGMPEIWRVPYLTYRNGGGPFIIAYILLMLVCGLPLYFLELSLSQYSGKGPWKFWDICPLLRGIGIAIAVINGISSVNTVILETWAFQYFVNSFKSVLPWTNCENDWNTHACFGVVSPAILENSLQNVSGNHSYLVTAPFSNNSKTLKPVEAINEFWLHKVLRVSGGIQLVGSLSFLYVVYLFVFRLMAALTMVKSVKSIGKMMYITALLPVVFILTIWIRALTLPGSTDGMRFLVSFDFGSFGNFQLWIEAAFQTFNTLGPGWGGLMMMGAHNTFRTNCFRASLITTSATFIFGLINSLVVFSVLGVMAEEIGVSISDVMTSGGFSIGFIAYPKALSYFPLPQLWSVLFYLVILLPGLDVMTIDTEPVLMILEEMFPKFLANRRIPLLGVVSFFMFLASLPLATEAGVYIFLLVNWYTGTWSVMLICLAECIVFAWIYGTHRIDRDIRLMLGRPLPSMIRFSTAFIMPVFLTCLLFISIVTYKPPSFGLYNYPVYARGIGWCFTLSSILPALAYCVWIAVNTEGTVIQRLKHLARRNEKWGADDDKANVTYLRTEKSAKLTWREQFWFNLTGRGGLQIECLAMEEDEDATTMF